MAVHVCKPRRTFFEISVMVIGLSAGAITLLQRFTTFSVAEDSIISVAPSDPLTSFLAIALLVIIVLFLNKTRK